MPEILSEGLSEFMLYNALYMAATRTQVYLTKEQRQRLDALGARQGLALAQLIRDAVDLYLEKPRSDAAQALKCSFGGLSGLKVPSRDEWDRG